MIVSEILVQLAAYTTSGGQYDQAPRLILQVNICFGHVANKGLLRVRECARGSLMRCMALDREPRRNERPEGNISFKR